jgi:hypothetical protein
MAPVDCSKGRGQAEPFADFTRGYDDRNPSTFFALFRCSSFMGVIKATTVFVGDSPISLP